MRKLLGIITTVFVTATAVVFAGAGTAAADPSASDWKALRQCESGNRYTINTGNGYYGAYQFDLGTWRSVGGSGYPHQASKAEQDLRALRLYRLRGWSPWICADLVGLKNDSDAGSGRIPTSPPASPSAPSKPSTPSKPVAGTPKYPGHQYRVGAYSASLKTWQKQMGKMGYGLTGTGYFGPKTKAAVLALQKRAGLKVVGYIGPKTWSAAWNTAYKKGAKPAAAKPAKSKPAAKPSAPTTYVPATDKSCRVGASKAPAFKGTTFRYGKTYRELQCFQRQLGHKGYGLTGTGYFGPATKAAVAKVQRTYHLKMTGVVDAATWKAAWQGSRK